MHRSFYEHENERIGWRKPDSAHPTRSASKMRSWSLWSFKGKSVNNLKEARGPKQTPTGLWNEPTVV